MKQKISYKTIALPLRKKKDLKEKSIFKKKRESRRKEKKRENCNYP